MSASGPSGPLVLNILKFIRITLLWELPKSLPLFLTRLPFFPLLVLTILYVHVPGSDSHFL